MTDKFNLTVRKETDFAVLSTEGYINHLGEKIADECNSLINAGYKKFVLNLEGSRVISSIGLAIFIEIIERLQQVNGSVHFCCLAPVIEKSFKIMGLIQRVRIFKTETEATEAIKKIRLGR